MVHEALAHLKLTRGSNVVDGTVGLGGHAQAILEATVTGKLLGLDRDAMSLKRSRVRLAGYRGRVILKQENFARLTEAVPGDFGPVQGVLFDLGISSWQLAERGFSFQADQPLDLRFDTREPLTAAQLVAELSERKLADLIYGYGEERRSRRIAKAIVTARRKQPITTTKQLAGVITDSVGRRGRLHPATLTFQALRIAVNDELESLKKGLAEASRVLAGHGRLVIITFHSLEDRIVKEHFRTDLALEVLTKKVVKPTRAEIVRNPRASSAKLRAAAKLTLSPTVRR